MDAERKRFEDWYVTHAFDIEENPLGSRECGLQWAAWQAALVPPAEGIPRAPMAFATVLVNADDAMVKAARAFIEDRRLPEMDDQARDAFCRALWRYMGAVARFKPTSGSYGQDVAKLIAGEFLSVPKSGFVALTLKGQAAAAVPPPFTPADLRQAWLDLCSEPQARILRVLIGCYPEQMHRKEVATACDPPFSPTSGSYGQDVAYLITIGAAEAPAQGFVKAATILFPDR